MCSFHKSRRRHLQPNNLFYDACASYDCSILCIEKKNRHLWPVRVSRASKFDTDRYRTSKRYRCLRVVSHVNCFALGHFSLGHFSIVRKVRMSEIGLHRTLSNDHRHIPERIPPTKCFIEYPEPILARSHDSE